jgi:hypothetical protein
VAGHIGTGAFNSLNAAALAVGGDALIDRSVVDVLGVAGAAQVLARRVFSDMGGDADKVREAVEAWHVENSDQKQVEAVKKAQEYHDAAAVIELPEASTGHDLAAAWVGSLRRGSVSDTVAKARGLLFLVQAP